MGMRAQRRQHGCKCRGDSADNDQTIDRSPNRASPMRATPKAEFPPEFRPNAPSRRKTEETLCSRVRIALRARVSLPLSFSSTLPPPAPTPLPPPPPPPPPPPLLLTHNCAGPAILPAINERYLTVHLPELAAELFGVIGNFTITLRR